MEVKSFLSVYPYYLFTLDYSFPLGKVFGPRICYPNSIYLITEGSGYIELERTRHALHPGVQVYIPAGMTHSWIADSDKTLSFKCLFFDWIPHTRYGLERRNDYICENLATQNNAYIDLPIHIPIKLLLKVDSIKEWIDLYEQCAVDEETLSFMDLQDSLRVKFHFYQFMEYFVKKSHSSKSMSDPRIRKIVQLLSESNQLETIDLEKYAELLGLSRSYFYFLFRQETGASPKQYVNRLRMHKIREELRNTTMSITEIAKKYSYPSIHYFSRAFSKHTGETPTAYRGRFRLQ